MHYEKVRMALGGVKSRQMHKTGGSSHHFVIGQSTVSYPCSIMTCHQRCQRAHRSNTPHAQEPSPTLTFNDLAPLPAPPTPAKTQHLRSL